MKKLFLDGRGLDLADAVHAQSLYDIRYLTHALGARESLSGLARVTGFVTRYPGEIDEMLLSAGCTAALVGYRRPGSSWRYPPAVRKSERGDQLIDALDDLRTSIALVQHTIDALARMRTGARLATAVALAGLALDAIDDDHLAAYIRISGIPDDAVDIAGAALDACESRFALPQQAPPKRLPPKPAARLTGNPARASRITEIRHPAAVAIGGPGFCGKNKEMADG